MQKFSPPLWVLKNSGRESKKMLRLKGSYLGTCPGRWLLCRKEECCLLQTTVTGTWQMPGQDFPGQCLASIPLIKSSSVRVWCQLLGLMDSFYSTSVGKIHIENMIIVHYCALNETHHISGLGIFQSEKYLMLSVPPDSTLDPELAQLGSLGFTGCLSSVLFNTISPLKAALLHPDTSSIAVRGPLARSVCGSPAANLSAAESTHHLSG